MTKEQLQQFRDFANALKHNRDYYSQEKIIELMVDKVEEIYKRGSFCKCKKLNYSYTTPVCNWCNCVVDILQNNR